MHDQSQIIPGVSPEISRLLGFVADRDEPCPACGYSLRGLTRPICPECGASLTLRVGSPQLRVGAWVLAIVSFALALGFDGVVAALLIVAIVASGPTQWEPIGIASGFVVLAILMLSGLIVVARSRVAWTRLATNTQWVRSGTVFCCVGVLHGFVGLVLFLAAQ
jgi:hypothetical protein